jgi:AraC-like DNA-binding protein
MPISSHYSALSSWILLIAKAIDSYGLDSRELFAKADLDHALLKDPMARFSATAVQRLWRIAAKASRDPGFGLTVASFWHPTTFYALGYTWLASRNLAEAFDHITRYARIVNTAAQGVLQLETTPEHYRVIIGRSDLFPEASDAQVDALVAMLLIMCRVAYGASFELQRVTFQHKAPANRERFDDFFQAPVLFSEGEDSLWIDPELMQQPLATANPELVRINDHIVTDYLAQLDLSDLGMRVRSQLIKQLPGGHFGETEIARSLNVSLRSLQRKLSEQGMTFKQLVETTRRDLALQYVRDTKHSFNEIAFLLGFTEPANFSRAFKRWHDKTPSQFRQEALS